MQPQKREKLIAGILFQKLLERNPRIPLDHCRENPAENSQPAGALSMDENSETGKTKNTDKLLQFPAHENSPYPKQINPETKLASNRQSARARDIEIEQCRRDPWHWLMYWVWTRDEHDRAEPFKRFPDKEYLRTVTRTWQCERLLLIPKSRQMMITWLMTALFLHDTQFFPGRLTVFQSKKEADASALVRRAKVIYDRQPYWMKLQARYRESPEGELFFPDIDSRIISVPQGADQLRMHTISGLFIDEAAFQPKLSEAWTAAKPTIDRGDCRVTMVSSAHPSFFEKLVNDRAGK